MRYGIAIWNYREQGTQLLDLIREFADFGFDCLSCQSRQLVHCEDSQAGEIVAALDERDLRVTMHGNFDMTQGEVETAVERLGDRLLTLTLDAAMTSNSCGHFYDSARMARFLNEVEEITRGTSIRFGVEDFPLDKEALDAYRSDLGALLECDRYGMLLDLGHLNMRARKVAYFQQWGFPGNVTRAPLPVLEVHVHDNRGERDDHGHLGFGNAPFAEIARGLREINFDGVSTIEIAPSFHGSSPAESKPRARQSLECWQRIWDRSAEPAVAAEGEAPVERCPGTEVWLGS